MMKLTIRDSEALMFPSKALAILEPSAQDYLLLVLPVSELGTAMI